MTGGRIVAAIGLGVAALVATPFTGEAQVDVLDGAPLCGLEAGWGAAVPDDGVIRVATYNVLHSQGDVDDATLDQRVGLVVGELVRAQLDVAGLQEAVRSTNHGVVAQRIAAGLSAETGDDWGWCFFQSNPHVVGEPDLAGGGVGGPGSQAISELSRPGDAPWAEGVAVVSRFPIEATAAHRLPGRLLEVPFCIAEHPDDPLAGPTCQLDTRTVLHARLATSCGGLDLFTSHLANTESSRSEATRERQVADALAWIDSRSRHDNAPDLYVGDFNTLEDGPVWNVLAAAGFVDTYRTAEPESDGWTSGQAITAPDSTVSRRIDYVFARAGRGGVTPAEAAILGDSPAPRAGGAPGDVVWPSDHYGVAVNLELDRSCVATETEPSTPAEPSIPAGPEDATGGSLPETGVPFGAGPVVAVLALFFGLRLVLARRREPPLP